jgi:hypothetical protein
LSYRSRRLLERRPISAALPVYIGKESNNLEERQAGLLHSLDGTLATYHDPSWDAWKTVTVPALRGFTAPEIAARSGLHRRTVERHLSGRAVPHPRQRAILTAIAVDLARACLSDLKLPSPREPIACLAAYLDTRERRGVGRYCVVCSAALAGRQLSTAPTAARSTPTGKDSTDSPLEPSDKHTTRARGASRPC